MCNASRFRQGGSGPKNRRVERREASVPRMRKLRELVCEGTRGRAHLALRACVTGPRRGADAPRAPVGAPLPRVVRGETANLGEHMPREKDDACAHLYPVILRRRGASLDERRLRCAMARRRVLRGPASPALSAMRAEDRAAMPQQQSLLTPQLRQILVQRQASGLASASVFFTGGHARRRAPQAR